MTPLPVFRYESKREPPLPARHFARRLIAHLSVVLGVAVFSLGVGMFGYMRFEGLSSLDAFLNTSMLLGGMGPIHSPSTFAGKLFAGCYALYAGLVFLVATGILAAPIVHRVLHNLHWDEPQSS